MYQDQMQNGYANKITIQYLFVRDLKSIGLTIGKKLNKLRSIYSQGELHE